MKQTTDQILEELDVKTALQRSTKANHWDLSNQILYDLCSQYPKHTDPGQIVAKVLMIGRVYAAALERIKVKTIHINDDFYLEAIVPLFETSGIDQKLAALKGKTLQGSSVFLETLQLHAYLVRTIGSLESETKYLKKRSFASKYLHFHEPELFFIYDSRAQDAIRKFRIKTPEIEKLVDDHQLDKEYSKFAASCLQLKTKLKQQKIQLDNRHLDNLLIELANEKLKVKRQAASRTSSEPGYSNKPHLK